MQVFKLFFKVLRKYIGPMITYVSIFLSICIGVIIPNVVKTGETGYTEMKSDFAVFCYEESTLSNALIEYLSKAHVLEEIKDAELETIQDELYATNIDSVIIINEGFEEAFLKGEADKYLDVYSIPNTIASMLFEQTLNSYLSMADTYVKAGFALEDAVEKAAETVEASVPVEISTGDEKEAGSLHYYFKYLSWIFIAMCVNSISIVLLAIDKKTVRDRLACSSYKFSKLNLETVLAVMVVGTVICGICSIAAFIVFPKEMGAAGTIYYILNAFCIMAVALAITFLVSKLTTNTQVISLMANVIGLGMAFMCGVFVPLGFLSDTVIKIAHFLPVYWNVRAVEAIDSFGADKIGEIFSYMGIQLLFAAAIICVGMLVARSKRVSRG